MRIFLLYAVVVGGVHAIFSVPDDDLSDTDSPSADAAEVVGATNRIVESDEEPLAQHEGVLGGRALDQAISAIRVANDRIFESDVVRVDEIDSKIEGLTNEQKAAWRRYLYTREGVDLIKELFDAMTAWIRPKTAARYAMELKALLPPRLAGMVFDDVSGLMNSGEAFWVKLSTLQVDQCWSTLSEIKTFDLDLSIFNEPDQVMTGEQRVLAWVDVSEGESAAEVVWLVEWIWWIQNALTRDQLMSVCRYNMLYPLLASDIRRAEGAVAVTLVIDMLTLPDEELLKKLDESQIHVSHAHVQWAFTAIRPYLDAASAKRKDSTELSPAMLDLIRRSEQNTLLRSILLFHPVGVEDAIGLSEQSANYLHGVWGTDPVNVSHLSDMYMKMLFRRESRYVYLHVYAPDVTVNEFVAEYADVMNLCGEHHCEDLERILSPPSGVGQLVSALDGDAVNEYERLESDHEKAALTALKQELRGDTRALEHVLNYGENFQQHRDALVDLLQSDADDGPMVLAGNLVRYLELLPMAIREKLFLSGPYEMFGTSERVGAYILTHGPDRLDAWDGPLFEAFAAIARDPVVRAKADVQIHAIHESALKLPECLEGGDMATCITKGFGGESQLNHLHFASFLSADEGGCAFLARMVGEEAKTESGEKVCESMRKISDTWVINQLYRYAVEHLDDNIRAVDGSKFVSIIDTVLTSARFQRSFLYGIADERGVAANNPQAVHLWRTVKMYLKAMSVDLVGRAVRGSAKFVSAVTGESDVEAAESIITNRQDHDSGALGSHKVRQAFFSLVHVYRDAAPGGLDGILNTVEEKVRPMHDACFGTAEVPKQFTRESKECSALYKFVGTSHIHAVPFLIKYACDKFVLMVYMEGEFSDTARQKCGTILAEHPDRASLMTAFAEKSKAVGNLDIGTAQLLFVQ